MVPLTTAADGRTNAGGWTASLYAGLLTAIVALAFVLLRGVVALPALLGLLLGAAPVIGYQVAQGRLGANWRSVIGGVLGFVLFVALLFLPGEALGFSAFVLAILSTILWPILVGAMTEGQSIGRLFGYSFVGLVLGLIVFFAVAIVIGQDPYAWPGPATVVALAVWGGTVGSAMASYPGVDV